MRVAVMYAPGRGQTHKPQDLEHDDERQPARLDEWSLCASTRTLMFGT